MAAFAVEFARDADRPDHLLAPRDPDDPQRGPRPSRLIRVAAGRGRLPKGVRQTAIP